MNALFKYVFSRESLLIQLIITIYLLTSYVPHLGVYVSVSGTALIILSGWLFLKKNIFQTIGLNFTVRDWMIIPLVVMITAFTALVIIGAVARENGYIRIPSLSVIPTLRSLHTIGQTLNEEIVLGFILIMRLRLIPLMRHPFILSVSASMIFVVFHYLFYLLSPYQGSPLDAVTLFNIFLIGIVRYNLILKFNHIGYAWAVHYGWNYVMFGGEFYRNETLIREYDVFNDFIGSPECLVLFLLIAAATFFMLMRPVKTVTPS